MSLASVHYVFASREELLREAIRLVVADTRGAAFSFLDGAVPSADADVALLVSGALASYVDLLRADPQREQGMLELTHHALRTPELAKVVQEQYAAYHALAAELLTTLAERCALRWLIPVSSLARLVISFTDGLTVQWLVSPDAEALQDQIAVFAAGVASVAEPAA
jgi:AcrR family transcriptional regulator